MTKDKLRLNQVKTDEEVELELDLAQMETQASFDTLFDGNIWICDTGASSHLTNNLSGVKNVQDSGTLSL